MGPHRALVSSAAWSSSCPGGALAGAGGHRRGGQGAPREAPARSSKGVEGMSEEQMASGGQKTRSIFLKRPPISTGGQSARREISKRVFEDEEQLQHIANSCVDVRTLEN